MNIFLVSVSKLMFLNPNLCNPALISMGVVRLKTVYRCVLNVVKVEELARESVNTRQGSRRDPLNTQHVTSASTRHAVNRLAYLRNMLSQVLLVFIRAVAFEWRFSSYSDRELHHQSEYFPYTGRNALEHGNFSLS